jgi:hypothetical protein
MALSSARHKLKQAKLHRKSLDAAINLFRETKPRALVGQIDPEWKSDSPKGRRWISRINSEPPKRISLVVGDCLFDLRSALDHLVRDLGQRTGRCITDADFARTEFPIFKDQFYKSRKPTIDSVRDKACCVCSKALTEIELLQPYVRRQTAPETDPLWILQELHNWDKHNVLLLTSSLLLNPKMLFPFAENVEVIESTVIDANWPFPNDAPVLRARFRIIDQTKGSDVGMQPNFAVDVAFDHTNRLVPSQQVTGVLDSLIEEVGAVINMLEPLCP